MSPRAPHLVRRAVVAWLAAGAVASVAGVTRLQFASDLLPTLAGVPTAMLVALLAAMVCPVGALACLFLERRA
jgi:hypothetical protein